METKPRTWPVAIIQQRRPRINPKPQYQRTAVWNEAKKQLLIDSMLRGYDIPKLYLRTTTGKYEHEATDGQQRLLAIWSFLDNEFPLGENSDDLPDFGDLSGKYWDNLPSDAKDKIGLFEFNIVEIYDATELEVRDLFLRLQEGVTLNPAERRNAMPGKMRDFVADLGEKHAVFKLIHIKPNRYAHHDLAALVMGLEVQEGPCDIKAPDLRNMYENEQNFNRKGPVARKVKRVLNYLTKVLKSQPPEMDIKWGFVDLYLLVSQFDEQYVLAGREEDILSFYMSLEQERRSVEDPADLLAGEAGEWDRDLFHYIDAFQRSGGTKKNVQVRHEVYGRRALKEIGNLVPKDPTRDFTHDERLILFRRANGRCQECDTNITFDTMHADHIKPHSKGGRTILSNGQALCGPCNQQKAAAG